MAIIKPSPFVEAISGTIGGITFANSKNGTTVRMRGRKKKATSAPQLAQQAKYADALHQWRDLSDDDRTAWQFSASQIQFPNALGTNRRLNGYQLFMKNKLTPTALFVQRDSIPFVPIVTASATSITPTFTSGGSKLIAWSSPGIFDTALALVYGSRPVTTAPVTAFRFWTSVGQFITTIPPINVADRWDDLVGDPQPGETVGIRFVPWSNPSIAALPFETTTTVL